MSNSSVITVEHLGKMYHIGLAQKRPATAAEAVKQILGAPFSYLRTHIGHLIADKQVQASDSPDIFWALRDVSFEVKQGEVLGIIGRNGAGKSTLLKILSRITDPTEGRVIIKGRVNSLLEVGTGFHPDLTGRENIFMNAALHGLKRREIARKLDEIVDFSEIEQFVDTPVKRYSSGMYTRLAFAVAAHLEPDVLIVDEVLAVGDASFQKKCLGKMNDVAKGGRTVLFVSHNMAAVEHLCSRAIVLVKGRKVIDDKPSVAIAAYLQSPERGEQVIETITDRKGNGKLRFTSFRIEDMSDGKPRNIVRSGDSIKLIFGYTAAPEQNKAVTASFSIRTNIGLPLILHRSNYTGTIFSDIPKKGEFTCCIPRFPLVEGRYDIVACLHDGDEIADLIEPLVPLNVERGDFFGTGHSGQSQYGLMLVDGEWSMLPDDLCKVDHP